MSSNTWISLLRGINLGRNKRIAMSDLRLLLESLGYGDVRTHLQSGNALFTLPSGKASDLEAEIEKAIDAKLGLDVKVIVRSAKEFASVVEKNPFVDRKVDPKQLGVVFLSANAPAKKLATVIERSCFQRSSRLETAYSTYGSQVEFGPQKCPTGERSLKSR